MCNYKDLQDRWLVLNQPKKLITIFFPYTPILHVIEQSFPTGFGAECTSGRTLYQRRFIEQVRGKTCSMCGTILNGNNTCVIYYIYPKKYKEEVYCKCCNNISPNNKKIIRKNGYDVYEKVISINNQIAMYREHLKSLKEYKKEIASELERINYYATYRSNCSIMELKEQLDKTKIKIDIANSTLANLNSRKKSLLGSKSGKPFPKYEIDYNEIIPFRSEEDFDF